MSNHVPHGGFRNEQRLTPKNATGVHQPRVVAHFTGEFSNRGVVHAGHCRLPAFEGSPMLQVMANMPVELQVIFKK
jgi:hypothetical protein